METHEAEQLDVLLNEFMKVLNKNHDTEEIDAFLTSKQYNRSPSPFENKDTQTKIIIVGKGTLIHSFLDNT